MAGDRSQDNARKLVVSEWMTLDGVIDAETMGQWFEPYHSDERGAYIQKNIDTSDAIVCGRVTYEMLAPHWSALGNNEFGIADRLNSLPKYVVSSTLKEADWTNSTIISERVVEEITRLKQQPGQDILVPGSATLVHSLMETDLIDEYRFLVHPWIMGTGVRFLRDRMPAKRLELIRTRTLSLGVILLCYQAAGAG